MPTSFFIEIVNILEETSLCTKAAHIVQKECKNLNVTPEEIHPKNGPALMLGILTAIGENLDKEEWKILDNQLKELLNRHGKEMLPGKVKGIVLSGTLRYVSAKGGENSLQVVKEAVEIANNPWEESWYPISHLGDILTAMETHMGTKNGSRCTEVGNQVISYLSFLFESDSQGLYCSLEKLKGLLELKEFTLRLEDASTMILEFDEKISQSVVEFMKGMCEGIFSTRKINATFNVVKCNSKNLFNIRMTLTGPKEVTS